MAPPGTYAVLDRTWRDGDVVTVQLPMPLTVRNAIGGGVYVDAGPLLYSFPIKERWEEDKTDYPEMRGKRSANSSFRCWSITPSGPWNFGLAGAPTFGPKADRGLNQLFRTVSVPARRVQWELSEGKYTPPLPAQPKAVTVNSETLTLIPYGLTQLRLTVFPSLL